MHSNKLYFEYIPLSDIIPKLNYEQCYGIDRDFIITINIMSIFQEVFHTFVNVDIIISLYNYRSQVTNHCIVIFLLKMHSLYDDTVLLSINKHNHFK